MGDRFGHFIDGAFTAPGAGFESKNPATGEVLANITQATQTDVDAAVKAARKAQPKWEKLGGPGRARYLYAIARLLHRITSYNVCYTKLLRVPVLLAPKSLVVVEASIWDDAKQAKINTEPRAYALPYSKPLHALLDEGMSYNFV